MTNLIGKQVELSEKIKSNFESHKYFEQGYKIGYAYTVIDQQEEYGTIKLSNYNGKELWFDASVVHVLKNESEAILVQSLSMFKDRKDKIYLEIKRLQSEAELIDCSIKDMETLRKGIE